MRSRIEVRGVQPEEAGELFKLEPEIWPEGIRASFRQLMHRFEVFPEGVVGVWVDGVPVGYGTSQIVDYTPGMSEELLVRYLPSLDSSLTYHDPNGNCLHLVSGGVLPSHRNLGLWKLLIGYRMALAKMMGKRFILVDSRMPSFSSRRVGTQALNPREYSLVKTDGHPVDVNISVLEGLSFKLLLGAPSSYADPESGNHWVFMVRETNRRESR